MADKEQFATKQDFTELKVELKQDIAEVKQDLTEVEQDIAEVKHDLAEVKHDLAEVKQDIAEVKQDLVQMEGRLRNDLTEVMREMQTEILRGLERFAKGNFSRMHRLEVSDIDTNERINALEERVLALEVRQPPIVPPSRS